MEFGVPNAPCKLFNYMCIFSDFLKKALGPVVHIVNIDIKSQNKMSWLVGSGNFVM